MNQNYQETKAVTGTMRAAAGLPQEPQKAGPVGEALSTLYNVIGTAQKNQEALETQLSPVLTCYPVNPFAGPGLEEKRDSTGCRLSDDIFELVRMVNSLVDRQEAMSRGVQL